MHHAMPVAIAVNEYFFIVCFFKKMERFGILE
jgi:hypothetical protein